MKEMNRREFPHPYRRSCCGAFAGRLRRASAPPAAPTGKEAGAAGSYQQVWKKKNYEERRMSRAADPQPDAVDAIRLRTCF